VLRREVGIEEQLAPGVVEALRGIAEEPEAHADRIPETGVGAWWRGVQDL
jgi:hypothetical protein